MKLQSGTGLIGRETQGESGKIRQDRRCCVKGVMMCK